MLRRRRLRIAAELSLALLWMMMMTTAQTVHSQDSAAVAEDTLFRPAELPPQVGAILFEKPYFAGRSRSFTFGSWNFSEVEWLSGQNFASIRLDPGVDAVVFEGADHSGPEIVFTDSVPELVNIKSLLRSIRVELRAGVLLFEQEGYEGRRQFLPIGDYDTSYLRVTSIGSIYVPHLVAVEFFGRRDFTSNILMVNSPRQTLSQNLSPSWIGSARVIGLVSAILFRERNFVGESITLGLGSHHSDPFFKQGKALSARVYKGLKVTLFLGGQFGGPALVLTTDWANFSRVDGMTEVTSVRVEAICSRPCIHGVCTAPETCLCERQWGGDDCSQSMCDPTCQHGKCTEYHNCECERGWLGNDCSTAICSPACVHGTCIAPNVCKCDEDYVGATCARLAQVCGNGQCDKIETCESCPADCGPCNPGRPERVHFRYGKKVAGGTILGSTSDSGDALLSSLSLSSSSRDVVVWVAIAIVSFIVVLLLLFSFRLRSMKKVSEESFKRKENWGKQD